MGELIDALVRRLAPGSVLTSSTVVSVEKGDDRYDVLTQRGERISGHALVFATPAYVTADLLMKLDQTLGQLCSDIPYVSTATVALAYSRRAVTHPLNGSGFVVPCVEPGWTITAGSWVSSKWPSRAPEGQVLLRAFLGGARSPEVLNRSDTDLIKVAHRDLATLLGIREEPEMARLYRWPRSTPQYEVGHLARLAAVKARLQSMRGIYLTGSGFRGTGIPDCIADARSTAEIAAGELRDGLSRA